MGLAEATVVAPPSADLWDGQTDEDELGFTYDFIELFTGMYLKLDAAKQVMLFILPCVVARCMSLCRCAMPWHGGRHCKAVGAMAWWQAL